MKLDPVVAHFEYLAQTRSLDYYDDLLAFLPDQAACVLDAGCGSGRVTLCLGARAKFVVGMDILPQMIELARGRQVEHASDNVVWVIGDVQHPPFRSECFDFVISANALRLTNAGVSLPRLARLIRPGGRIAVKDIVTSPRRLRIRPLWYLYATLRIAFAYAGAYNLDTSLRFIAYRLGRAGLRQGICQQRFTPATFMEFCGRLLPGCTFKTGKRDAVAFWIKSPHKSISGETDE